MATLTAAEIDAIAGRHPAVFAGSLRKRIVGDQAFAFGRGV